MQFFSHDDAYHRLTANLIQHEGRILYVSSVGTSDGDFFFPMDCKDIKTGEKVSIKLNQEFIYPPKFELGFVNYFQSKEPSVLWVERRPRRSRPMGLNVDNLVVTNPSGGYNNSVNTSSLMMSNNFYDMLINRYPSVDKCLKAPAGLAFAKDFALVRLSLRSWGLYYRNNKIGEFDKSFELYPPFEHIKEHLERTLAYKGEEYAVTLAETTAA